MKNKSTLFIGILIVIFLIGGIFFLMKNKPGSSPITDTTRTESDNPLAAGNTSTSNTFAQLLTMGGNQECVLSYKASDTSSMAGQGKMYISGDKMRGEISINLEKDKAQVMTMLKDKDYMYFWGEGTPQGMKMELSKIVPSQAPNADKTTGSNSQASQVFNMEQKVDFSCNPWTPDQKMFELPKDVTFQDLTKLMEQYKTTVASPKLAPGTQDSKASQCALCENLEGKANTDCKAQLGCN